MIADEPAKGSRILLGARRGSVGQEGGWVVRGDGLGTEGDEVGVVGGGEGVDVFGGGEGLLAEGFSFGALCGVEDEDGVGEGGDAGIAAGGGGSGFDVDLAGLLAEQVRPDTTATCRLPIQRGDLKGERTRRNAPCDVLAMPVNQN